MNTKPDDELLALWVEDELDVTIHTEIEVWALAQPEWVERRELARASRKLLGELDAHEDVPNAEFFNARIMREIEISAQPQQPAVKEQEGATVTRFPMRWLVPLTAAASLALGIFIGRGGPSEIEMVTPPVAELAPVLYTPERGVQAELVSNDEATVIVLAGVDAIPDDSDLMTTAMVEPELRPLASAY